MVVSDPLTSLLDEARANDAGAARIRERSLRRQAEEGASFRGTLLDLAERQAQVTVRTTAGRVGHGAVVAVGNDFVALRADDRGVVCVRLGALASVRLQAGFRQERAAGDRSSPLALLLVDVLAGLVQERARVALVTGADVVSGELRAVGADVVTVRLDGDRPGTCYLSAAAIDEVVMEPGP
ncbi:MAG: hypothetical protein M3503_06985 [Actinomycetota bacterium]|nr:hypothetical protein [Actinomycetota bacterium]